ncbi:hypothetical protein HIM_00864 [Hirsutella minnesotensis 3608]|nr:hypothetical protein HIM_00864 [Hirsutella minnesotensis 3608]
MKDDTSMSTTAEASGANTPSTGTSIADGIEMDYPQRVPWPGNTYKIIERASGRAMTLEHDKLCLSDAAKIPDTASAWLCVDIDGYFGFQNPKTGRYIGNDGNGGVFANATSPSKTGRVVPRRHPAGGYQLLMPMDDHSRLVTVAEDGQGLVLRHHGTTLWDFHKVRVV